MKNPKYFFALLASFLFFIGGINFAHAWVWWEAPNPAGHMISGYSCEAGFYENSCTAHYAWTKWDQDPGSVQVVAKYADGSTKTLSTATNGYESYTFYLPKYSTDKDVNPRTLYLYVGGVLKDSTSVSFSYLCTSPLVYRDVVEDAATFKHMMTCAPADPPAAPKTKNYDIYPANEPMNYRSDSLQGHVLGTGYVYEKSIKNNGTDSIPLTTTPKHLFQTAMADVRSDGTWDGVSIWNLKNYQDSNYTLTYTSYPNMYLPAGETRLVRSPVITESEYDYFMIRLCADKSSVSDTGIITETDENNNCSPWEKVSFSAPVIGQPDLRADIDNLSYVYPNNFVVNTDIVFSGPVGNGGNANTNYKGVNTFTNKFQTATDVSNINNPTGVVNYDVSGMTNLVGSEDITNPWKSTSTYARFSKTIKFTSTGTYYIRTCADSLNTIAEAHENDNCSSWMTINILASGAPDLQASVVTPATSVAGTDQTFSARITNFGNMSTSYLGVLSFGNLFQTASGFDLTNGVTDYNKPFDLTNYAPTWTSNLRVLKSAGSNYTINGNVTYDDQSQISMSIKFPEARTYYYVRACADKASAIDNNGVIVESNESNNCGAWTSITVTPAPTTCLDSTAQNYNLKLPCFYVSTFCKVETDVNYGKAPCAVADPCGGNGANNPPLCNMKCS